MFTSLVFSMLPQSIRSPEFVCGRPVMDGLSSHVGSNVKNTWTCSGQTTHSCFSSSFFEPVQIELLNMRVSVLCHWRRLKPLWIVVSLHSFQIGAKTKTWSEFPKKPVSSNTNTVSLRGVERLSDPPPCQYQYRLHVKKVCSSLMCLH